MRFYGFEAQEIAGGDENLDLEIDPKLAWALRHREDFPVDLNRADRERMLRVPGLGVTAVDRLIELRRHKRLRLEDVKRISRGLKTSRPFIVVDDWRPTALADRAELRPAPQQLSLF